MQQKMPDTLSYPSSQKCILMVTCQGYIALEYQLAVKVAITLLFFISILLTPQSPLLFELPAERAGLQITVSSPDVLRIPKAGIVRVGGNILSVSRHKMSSFPFKAVRFVTITANLLKIILGSSDREYLSAQVLKDF